MCEKCNNGLGGDIFIIPEEIVGILTKRIEEYKTRYNGMPSRETIVQMILSAKAEIAPQKDECPVSNDNLRLAFITQNKADNKTDIRKNETEISFEQCVETASGKIKEVIAALKMEYSDVILSHAIDVINDSKSEDAIVGIDKEFDSELFKILEIMSKARKALKTESIINHDDNVDRRKQLNVIIDEMTVWIDKLYVAFDNKK